MAGPEELIQRHDDAWNRQDVDALTDLYAEDVVFENHTAGESPVEGREAVLAHIAGIFARWPDMQFASRRLYVSNDCCTSEWTARATTPDGRRIEWDGVDVMPIHAGAIARKDVYSTSHIAREARDA